MNNIKTLAEEKAFVIGFECARNAVASVISKSISGRQVPVTKADMLMVLDECLSKCKVILQEREEEVTHVL